MRFRDIGLSIANGIISLGIFKIFNMGFIAFIIKSNIPDTLRALIAINKPIKVGNMFTTIPIPSFAPSIKISKVFFFSINPFAIIISITSGIDTIDK